MALKREYQTGGAIPAAGDPYTMLAQAAGQTIGTGSQVAAGYIEDPETSTLVSSVGQGLGSGSPFGPAMGLIKGIQANRAREQQAEQLAFQRGQAINQAAYAASQPEPPKPQLRFGGAMKLTHFKGPDHENGGIHLRDAIVEGEETKMGNYVFSDHLTPKGPGDKKMDSFAKMSRNIDSKYERHNDPFEMASRGAEMSKLAQQQEVTKKKYKCGGKTGKYEMGGFIEGDPMSIFLSADSAQKPELQNGGGITNEERVALGLAERMGAPTLSGTLTDLPTTQRFETQTRKGLDPLTGEVAPKGTKGLVNVKGYDSKARFEQAGIPFNIGNVNAFEDWAVGKGYLPKYGKDQRWGPEHDRVFQQYRQEFIGSPEFQQVNQPQGIGGYQTTADPRSPALTTPQLDPTGLGVSAGGTPEPGLSPFQGPDSEVPSGINPFLAAIPNVAGGIAGLALANRVNYERTRPFTVDPSLLDPTRALQNVGTAFSGVNQAIADTASGGTALTNRIVSAGREAGARADVATDYEARNKAILNQTEQFNAQARARAAAQNAEIQRREAADRLGLQQGAISSFVQAGSDVLGQYGRNQQLDLAYRQAQTPNYYVDETGNVSFRGGARTRSQIKRNTDKTRR